MSARLARLANRVERRKSRGIKTPAWAEVKGVLPASDPWASIPEADRFATIETLAGGTVVTSYYGTVEEHRAPRAAPPPPPPPAVDNHEDDAAAPVAATARPRARRGEGRFSEYPMPGHERR